MSSFTGLLEVVDTNGTIFQDSSINDIVIYSETINNTYNSILLGCGINNTVSTIKINNNLIELNGNSIKKKIYEELWPNGTNTFKTMSGTLGNYTHSSSIIYFIDNIYKTPSGGRYQLWTSAPQNTFFTTPTFNLLNSKTNSEDSIFIEIEIYANLQISSKILEFSIYNGNTFISLYKISSVTYYWHKIKICLDQYLSTNNYFKLQYSDIQNSNEYIGVGNILIYSINMNSTKKYVLKSNNSSNIQNIVPIGTIIGYSSSVLPNANWKFCNGDSLSRTTYSDLFNIISTNYGFIDSTVFNIPNINGKFIASSSSSTNSIFKIDPSTSSIIGQNNVNININNFPNHSHTITSGQLATGIEDPNHTHSLTLSTLTASQTAASDTHNHTAANFNTNTQLPLTHTHQFPTTSSSTTNDSSTSQHIHTLNTIYGQTFHGYTGPGNITQVTGGAQNDFVQTITNNAETSVSKGNIVGTANVTADNTHSHQLQGNTTQATATHTHTALPSTTDTYTYLSHRHNVLAAATGTNTVTAHTHTIPANNSTGFSGNVVSSSSIPIETIPKSIAINYIIKVL